MRSRYRKILVAAGTALASMALLASAAQATTPAPPYEDFAGCPSPAEEPFIGNCIKLDFSSGHIGIGKRSIPVTNPILFKGGIEQETGNILYNAEGGIVPAQQTVPGGLIGLTGYKWLDELVESSSLLKLYATVELAGQPGSLTEPSTSFPVKVHLENPLLGSSCYVGSTASPIVLNLTTGTTSPPPPNKPISGESPVEFESEAERPAVLIASGTFVDNAYSVPAASGCVLNLGPIHKSIDAPVNQAYGLPAAAGTNETVLGFDLSLAFPGDVYP